MKLLLVEDNVDYAKLIIRTLETQGHEVVHKTNGWDSLKTVSNEYFHAILLDFGLPDINGLQLYRMLRPMLPTTPIVLLTAYTDKFSEEEARGFGFDGFMTKPLDLRTLVTAIARFDTDSAGPVENNAFLHQVQKRLEEILPALAPMMALKDKKNNESRLS